MINLTLSTDKVEFDLAGTVTTNELDWVAIVEYHKAGDKPIVENHILSGVSNGTTEVTILAGPDEQIYVRTVLTELYIFNKDTVATDVIVKLDRNGTDYILNNTTLAVDEELQYIDGSGFINPTAVIGDSAMEVLLKAYVDSISSGTGATPFSGALIERTSGDTAISTGVDIPWEAEIYDHGGWADIGGNPTRLTVPVGVTKVLITAVPVVGNPPSDIEFQLHKNGTIIIDQGGAYSRTGGQVVVIHSAVLEVVAGDYFEINPVFSSGTPDIRITSWFAIQAIETIESGRTATVETTDATPTVIASGAMAADSAHTIRAYGQGRHDATGDTYHFDLFGGARNEGGTSTVPATSEDVRSVEDSGVSSWGIILDVDNPTDVWELIVTGESGHTIDWAVTYFEIIQ